MPVDFSELHEVTLALHARASDMKCICGGDIYRIQDCFCSACEAVLQRAGLNRMLLEAKREVLEAKRERHQRIKYGMNVPMLRYDLLWDYLSQPEERRKKRKREED